ncbi:minor tail protein [Mycobacterium phage EagleEye]|uniref:DUF7572 domain-containing protein n=1 Tax=Mycobacterium phage EagleEye TaxID=1429759 RepID=W0LMP7_9CAUD|nr:minor tail protein [Mycobacterium phage EagleEye]AHG23814.1 hypothetical protein PBI_EAGLEEYE_34 [Mycobacterium phage EagleEye]QNJ55890.1 hypothetical protein SEA_PAINTERBOY_33 [Mycobacterium phage PainterBoy]
MPTATRLDTDMSAWPPGTQHFSTSDGEYLAVISDPGMQVLGGELIVAIAGHALVVPPTVIIACDKDGVATSMERLHTLMPGTSHEDALRQVGYLIS